MGPPPNTRLFTVLSSVALRIWRSSASLHGEGAAAWGTASLQQVPGQRPGSHTQQGANKQSLLARLHAAMAAGGPSHPPQLRDAL